MTSNSRQGNSPKDDRSYCFVVDNLPEHYGWQELKDLIRPIATVGYVTVAAGLPHQSRRKGWFDVKEKHNPAKLFSVLRKKSVEHHHLSIHYFECVGTGAVFVDCNCRDFSSDQQRGLHHLQASPSTSSWSGSLPSTPLAPSTISDSASEMSRSSSSNWSTSSAYSPSSMYSNTSQGYAPQYGQSPIMRPTTTSASYSVSSHAHYAYAHNGIPINTSNGVVATQHTWIHIKGLSYKTSQSSLERFLRDNGCEPLSCKLIIGSHGEAKGTATANYGSQDKARRAMERLDGETHKGKVIRVKLDRVNSDVAGDAGTSSRGSRRGATEQRPAMIMNGTGGRRDPNS